MNISIPCTWENDYLDRIVEINTQSKLYPITEIYGSLKMSVLGSGHSSAAIQGECNDRASIEKFVYEANRRGFEFNYVINASCLGNREFENGTRRKLLNELEWICSFSNSVTVTVPYLIELVKKISQGKTKIIVSTIVGVKTTKMIDRMHHLGVDRIVLDISVNRDLQLLREMKEMSIPELEILVNDSCLQDCPFRQYHYNSGSHASGQKSYYLEYCVYNCLYLRMKNPVEILKSPWIRPEDLKRYNGLVDYVKIGGREKNVNWIANVVSAYANGRYEGNAIDLLTITSPKSHEIGDLIFSEDFDLYLDNAELDQYFEHVLTACKKNCSKCNYCESYALDNLKFSQERITAFLGQYEKMGSWMFRPEGLNLFENMVGKFAFNNYVKDSFLWRLIKNRIYRKTEKHNR